MRAGTLGRQRVTIERRVGDVDSEGNPSTTWSPLATVWAAVEPLNARQALVAMAEQTRVSHQVSIRYRSGVDQDARIRLGTRLLSIESVIDTSERHQELVLLCQELEA